MATGAAVSTKNLVDPNDGSLDDISPVVLTTTLVDAALPVPKTKLWVDDADIAAEV
tara:strand:+ start:2247 stop:2414 length:168 start_codon:yes stop_codon:yes gene_type:complete